MMPAHVVLELSPGGVKGYSNGHVDVALARLQVHDDRLLGDRQQNTHAIDRRFPGPTLGCEPHLAVLNSFAESREPIHAGPDLRFHRLGGRHIQEVSMQSHRNSSREG
jgi:hypothetical protein